METLPVDPPANARGRCRATAAAMAQEALDGSECCIPRGNLRSFRERMLCGCLGGCVGSCVGCCVGDFLLLSYVLLFLESIVSSALDCRRPNHDYRRKDVMVSLGSQDSGLRAGTHWPVVF